MERAVTERLSNPQVDQNLYGVRLFLSGEYSPEDVRGYIRLQEKTHLAEGLELQQCSVSVLEFDGIHVLGFGGQPMVEVNKLGYREAKKQYLKGDTAAACLMTRRQHDVTASECVDDLMRDGQVGEMVVMFSPYEEELDDTTAQRLGFWPKQRRSYMWLFRKKSDHELERTDVSIDQSSMAVYRQLLGELGVEVDSNADSHDIPQYLVGGRAGSDEERVQYVKYIKERYQALSQSYTGLDTQQEAIEFLDREAGGYLEVIVRVHEAIKNSIVEGRIDDLVKLSARLAVEELNCLSREERQALHQLLTSEDIDSRHNFAFSTLIAAQRYGVWQHMSKVAGGQAPARIQSGSPHLQLVGVHLQDENWIKQIYENTNEAAENGKSMPGCAGGTSFLQQNEADVKSSIFNNSSNEKYSFNKEMYCVVCQAPPKEGAKKKWCGPCGICRGCDAKLKVKMSKAA